MKVASVFLGSFKRFAELRIDFNNVVTGDVANRFLLLGDNGTGKTTALQAIALALSLATTRTRSLEEFDWFGWLPGRYERWGRPIVEVEVTFTEDEIAKTKEIARRWYDTVSEDRRRDYVEPGDANRVLLRLEGTRCYTDDPRQLQQFRGRAYASQLVKRGDYKARQFFRELPDVFWFDQFRNLATVVHQEAAGSPTGRLAFSTGFSELRDILLKWKLARERYQNTPTDWYGQIESHYKALFPGRQFGEPEPMSPGGQPAATDLYFMLTDGERSYDLEEASAGEQSVIPILFTFVLNQIARSVVLIDEVDLNLHPPLAQALLNMLPRIGPECQYILSTHSEAVTGVMNPNQIYRFSGGRLCL